jgi:hypothetical protein
MLRGRHGEQHDRIEPAEEQRGAKLGGIFLWRHLGALPAARRIKNRGHTDAKA